MKRLSGRIIVIPVFRPSLHAYPHHRQLSELTEYRKTSSGPNRPAAAIGGGIFGDLILG